MSLIPQAIQQDLIKPASLKGGNYDYIRSSTMQDLSTFCDVFIGRCGGNASFYVITQDARIIELGTAVPKTPSEVVLDLIRTLQKNMPVPFNFQEFLQRARDQKPLKEILESVRLTNIQPRRMVRIRKTRLQDREKEEFKKSLGDYNTLAFLIRTNPEKRTELLGQASPGVVSICMMICGEEEARRLLNRFTPPLRELIIETVAKYKSLVQ